MYAAAGAPPQGDEQLLAQGLQQGRHGHQSQQHPVKDVIKAMPARVESKRFIPGFLSVGIETD